jgi:hypothetical protein
MRYNSNRHVYPRCRKCAVFFYIVIVSMFLMQGYRKLGTVFGSARLQVQQPDSSQSSSLARPPYCLGVNSTSIPGYSFPGNRTFLYSGSIVGTQYECQFQDAAFAVPDPFSTGGTYIPTRVTTTPQFIMPDDGSCASLSYAPPTCQFASASEPTTIYIANPRTCC